MVAWLHTFLRPALLGVRAGPAPLLPAKYSVAAKQECCTEGRQEEAEPASGLRLPGADYAVRTEARKEVIGDNCNADASRCNRRYEQGAGVIVDKSKRR